MITLKSKLLATLAVFLIASIALSSYIALTAAAPKEHKEKPIPEQKIYKEFILHATGKAYDSEGIEVDVVLDVVCKVNGKMNRVIHIRTQAGGGAEISVIRNEGTDEEIKEIIGEVSATKGHGIIINKCGFIHLNLMMSGQYYGGRSTVWVLRGHTQGLDECKDKNAAPSDILDVDLMARRVVLPTEEGYQQLKNLELTGKITFK